MSREELQLTIAGLKELLNERDSQILNLEQRVKHLKYLVETRENDIAELEANLLECERAKRDEVPRFPDVEWPF